MIITTDNFFPKCRPQDLENPITLTDDARNFMNFLNHGRPDLVIPSAADDLLPPGDEAGDAEDNLEDDEAASLGDQVHVVDDGFEGGSIDFGDEVVVDSNLGDPQAETTPWSWNGVLPFQPRGEIQVAPGGTLHRHSLLRQPSPCYSVSAFTYSTSVMLTYASESCLTDQATDNVFGRPRAGQQNTGISVHPLLVEDATVPNRGDGAGRSHRRMDLRSGSMDQWITAIENLLGGGAGQLIEQILGTVAFGQRPIHIDLGQGPNGPSLGGVVIDPTRGVVMPVGPQGLHVPTNAPPASRLDRHLADRVGGQTLMPLATLPRWSEEARVFHQTASSAENPSRIQNAILALLVPRAKKLANEKNAAKEKVAKLEAEAKRAKNENKSERPKTPVPTVLLQTPEHASVRTNATGADSSARPAADTSIIERGIAFNDTPLRQATDGDVEMSDGTDEATTVATGAPQNTDSSAFNPFQIRLFMHAPC